MSLILLFYYLNLVTKVDNNGMAHRWHIDPLNILEKLKSTDLIVLEEQNDATGSSMCSKSFD